MALDKEVLAHAKKQDELNKQSPSFQEYPKVLYGANDETRQVNSADEEKALKGKWTTSPKVTGALPEDAEAYEQEQDEDIEALKEQAKALGIEFHHNIGVEKLKKLIDDKRIETEQ